MEEIGLICAGFTVGVYFTSWFKNREITQLEKNHDNEIKEIIIKLKSDNNKQSEFKGKENT